MKAGLLILTTAIALLTAGPAFAEPYSPSDRTIFGGATQSAPIAPDDRPLQRPGAGQPALVVQDTASFDWTDAGLGAAAGFGVALVLLGGMLVIQRRVVATA